MVKEKSSKELFSIAEDLKLKAEFALSSIRDETKRLKIVEDSRKLKPTTEQGRLLRRAEHATARAENEQKKEHEKALKLEEKMKRDLEKEVERKKKEESKLLEKAKKDEEREKARLAKEASLLAAAEEKKQKEEERLFEKERKEAEKAAERAKKEEEKEVQRLAREAGLVEAANQKEAAKLAKEQAAAVAKQQKEQQIAAEKLEREAAKEAEKARLAEVKKQAEQTMVTDFVYFLLKNPRLKKEEIVSGFLDAKYAKNSSNKEFVTKASVRDAMKDIAVAAANHLDPLRKWEITEAGLKLAGLTQDEADAMRVEVPLTAEEKTLVLKKQREAKRADEKSKQAANKQKQASVLKGFFQAAPKKQMVPEPAVFVAPKPVGLSETREVQFVEAVRRIGGSAQTVSSFSVDKTLAHWKSTGRGVDSRCAESYDSNVNTQTTGRFGVRRGASKRKAGALSTDAATKLAIERSLVDSSAGNQSANSRTAKRRKLISVDCSSEYLDDSVDVDEKSSVATQKTLQYRFGFQLGLDQLDSKSDFWKTFPVPGGRPAFWGSAMVRGDASKMFLFTTNNGTKPLSQVVTGRKPFARDPSVEYVDASSGEFFDSGDEWDEPEEGENLEGSDLEEDEEEKAALLQNSDDEQEEGFVVPDGYLSAEENARGGEDELVDEEMDLGGEERGDDEEDGVVGVAGVAAAVVSGDDGSTKARAQLTQWMDRARRQNRPLVISGFAGVNAPGTPEGSDNAAHASLLAALTVDRFKRPVSGVAKRPVICMYAPPPTKQQLTELEQKKQIEEKSRREEERKNKEQEKVAEKLRKEADKEAARVAKELHLQQVAGEKLRKEAVRVAKNAEKELELEAKRAELERKKAEREQEKKAKALLKEQKAAEKASRKSLGVGGKRKSIAPGKVMATPAKGTAVSGGEHVDKKPKVSPIKSLFERAANMLSPKEKTAATAMDTE